jgi:hypothetical protein
MKLCKKFMGSSHADANGFIQGKLIYQADRGRN